MKEILNLLVSYVDKIDVKSTVHNEISYGQYTSTS